MNIASRPTRVVSDASRPRIALPIHQSSYLSRPLRVLVRHQNAILLLGVIVLIVLRAPLLLTQPRIWAEEGSYLNFALHQSALQTLFHLYPDSGYYLLSANLPALLSALVARTIGLEYAPLVSTYFSLCLQILPFAILIFGKSHLFKTKTMIVAGCLIILLAPTTSGEIWLNTVNSMSWTGLAALIILLEDTRLWSLRKKTLFRSLLLLLGLCGPYAPITFPLFGLSYFIYREKERLVQAFVLLFCFLLQAGVFAYVRQSGGAPSRLASFTIDSAVVNVFFYHFLSALGGDRGATAVFDHLGLTDSLHRSITVPRGGPVILAAYFSTLVMVLVLTYLWDKRLRSLNTLLIGTFVLFAAFTAIGAAFGVPVNRYAFLPGLSFLLFILSCVWEHRQKLIRIACCVALIVAIWNGARESGRYLNPAAGAPRWSEEVKKWRFDNTYQLRVWPSWWPVRVVAWDSRGQSKGRIDVLLDARYVGEPSPSLTPTTKLAQTFVAPRNGLTKVEIYLATYLKTIPSGTLKFRLLGGDGRAKVIASGSTPLSSIKDNSFVAFQFPSISDSARKTYMLELSTEDIPRTYGLSVWLSKTDLYADGTFLVNGAPTAGDAAFTVYSAI